MFVIVCNCNLCLGCIFSLFSVCTCRLWPQSVYVCVCVCVCVCVSPSHTWFLKESVVTGSSAAREMLLSRMKKRMRLVKMLWFTILWHSTLNLPGGQRQRGAETDTGG